MLLQTARYDGQGHMQMMIAAANDVIRSIAVTLAPLKRSCWAVFFFCACVCVDAPLHSLDAVRTAASIKTTIMAYW